MLQNSLNNQPDLDNLTDSSRETVFVFPTSFAQERLWFLEQLEAGSAVYNIPAAVRLSGQLDVTALEKSFNEILKRHEALRTSFASHPHGDPSQGITEGEPVQLIATNATLKIPIIDLQGQPKAEREEEAIRRAKEQGQQKFDLTQIPLLRVTLFQLDQQDYLLVLIMHHIISDAWSMGNLIQEMSVLYPAFSQGKASPLPQLPIQYADFAVWQRQQLQPGEVLAEQLNYWQQQLGGELPVLELPTDYTRPPVQTFRGAKQSLTLPHLLSEKLKRLSQQQGTTLYMTLLTAFKVLLHRYSGQTDLLVGSPIANRNRSEIENLIGFFVNTFVLRTNLSGNPNFLQLLDQVKQVTLEAYANQDLPFEKLVEALQPERSLSHAPLFQAMFVFQNASTEEFALPGLRLHSLELDNETAKFDLTLSVEEREGRLKATLDYSTDLFQETTINRMLCHFQTLLDGVVAHPTQLIADLPLLTSAERHQLLVAWNHTEVNYPQNQCIHQLFEEQVEQTPSAIALVLEGQHLTYRELNARANQLAHYLQQLGVGPEGLIGICLERSVELIVAMLGILKTGAAYLPLDPSYPQQHLDLILDDANVSILLTQQTLLQTVSQNTTTKMIDWDKDWQTIAQNSVHNPINTHQDTHLAYIIYTSGSTGRPKGVMVTHKALCNHMHWMRDQFGFQEKDCILQKTPFNFDASVWEFYAPLMTGARLVLAQPKKHQDSTYLIHLIQQEEVNIIQFVPSQLRVLSENSELPNCHSLKLVFSGGEPLTTELKAKILNSLNVSFYNLYGPTETTIDTTAYHCQGQSNDDQGLEPIGRPISNVTLYLLDTNLKPVPTGITGELYIGGAGLARGYRNRPELTAERFIPNPFSEIAGSRLYKTGDLARYLPNGHLKFISRSDNQVKIRGFRIEIGEIQTQLNQHPEVQETAVIVKENNSSQKQLIAYVVPHNAKTFFPRKLRTFLKEKLPDYMVPALFIALEQLPLTSNGKLDRNALPEPQVTRNSVESHYTAPQTHIEKQLATIWSQFLNINVDHIGIHDNFFELGGDSILSIQIVAKARKEGLQLTPKQLFQHQTVAQLATVVEVTKSPQAKQGIVTGSVPLTPIQHWFFEQNLPNSHHWNQAVLLETKESLEPVRLDQVVQQLMQHHDALRLRFFRKAGAWEQYNADFDGVIPLTHLDLSVLPKAEQKAAIEQAATCLQESLNLTQGPLLRIAQFNLGANQSNRLLIVIHHLAVDGVSWRILLDDFQTLYQQLQNHETLQLPEKTTSFQQWSQSLQTYAHSEKMQKELDYWVKTLSGVKTSSLPIDYASWDNTEESAQTISVALSQQDTESLLREVPSKYRTQINEILLTAFVQTFAQVMDMPSLLVNLEGHGREEIMESIDQELQQGRKLDSDQCYDLSRTVGWFTSIFPAYLDVAGVSNLGEAITTVKEQLRQIPNHGIGYGLLRYLGAKEVIEQLQVFPQPEVSFNYLGQFDQTLTESSLLQPAYEWKGWDRSLQGQRSHLIDVNGLIVGKQLQLNWTFSRAIHKQTTIENLAQGFIETLRSLIQHCQSLDSLIYTPSDFPLAKLSQNVLDQLSAGEKEIEDIYNLSHGQKGVLFHALYQQNLGIYVSQLSCTLSGNLNLSAFKQAWQTVINRHSILRTAFIWDGLEEPLQIIYSSVQIPIEEKDWRKLSKSEQNSKLEHFLQMDKKQGFNLGEAPIMRLTLIQTNEDSYQFIWSSHHILLDGWSCSALFKEIIDGYQAFCNKTDLIQEAPFSYRNYIAWLQQKDLMQAKYFWRDLLQGLIRPTSLNKLKTNQVSFHQSHNTAEQSIQLSPTTTETLQSIIKSHKITLHSLFQGIWALLLAYYSGEKDVVFGTTVSGRSQELQGIETGIGLFINTIPVRIQLQSEESFIDLTSNIQKQQIEARQYEYTPLTEIKMQSKISNHLPLFESILVFENYPVETNAADLDTEIAVQNVNFSIKNSYPITLRVVPSDTILINFMYDHFQIQAETIQHLLNLVDLIVKEISFDPNLSINKLLGTIQNSEQDWKSSKEEKINASTFKKMKSIKRKSFTC
ncbi:MAG: amino acid adenylation domain-containing protein [Cyanobacteria bacterium]|jgi:amino acid adenylation domain-containing protein/non-ribosomal peptide synthase protein (TIGR01720 family)|nr:amino acid adenylation domain-containing protein [Cyanobacteria bacterium GSL.Bin1]